MSSRPSAPSEKNHQHALSVALVLGVVVAAGAGATTPFLGSPQAVPPVVALVNHSAEDDALFLAQFCGAVVVDSATIITATHCLAGRAIDSIDAVAGVADLCDPGAAALPGYRRVRVAGSRELPRSAGTLSILELAQPLDPVSAPRGIASDPPARVHTGETVTGWGWGRDAIAGIPSCALRSVELTVVDDTRCTRIADETAGKRARVDGVCTVPTHETNTCSGDSGGPVLSLDDAQEWRVVAVTLAGEGCGPLSPGLSIAVDGRALG